MANIRVQRFSAPQELRFCASEKDVGEHGWSVVVPDGEGEATAAAQLEEVVTPETPTTGEGHAWRAEPGFSRECCEVFHEGEFVGDLREVELTESDGRPFAELVYAPLPPDE